MINAIDPGLRFFSLLICLSISMIGMLQCSADSAGADTNEKKVAFAGPRPTLDLPVSTPTPENTSLADRSPEYLCDHLVDLKHMPWDHDDYSGDAIYDALKRKGYDAMPCLVAKITDTQPAENPTGAPFWAGLTYRVGDTAVLMLMDINNMYWPKGMLAKKYEDMFESEGMFSYYFYVHEVAGARRTVQHWWRNWLRSCKPKCTVVPSIEH